MKSFRNLVCWFVAAYVTLKFPPTSFNNAIRSNINVKEIDYFLFIN